MGATIMIMVMIGLIDYVGGSEMSFSTFYLLAVFSAVWFVGRRFGVIISVLSVASWLVGDFAVEVHHASFMFLAWNAAILFLFYMVVVWLLSSLRDVNRSLEEKVMHRTEALLAEIAERKRLEKEILEVSEREQRRIGYDLHDSLCQHLTATAMAGQVLAEKLESSGSREAADAGRVVQLVEDGITQARNIARGLQLEEIGGEGLPHAFEDLAQSTSVSCGVECVFICRHGVEVHDVSSATHLYRIAQEAVANAVKHGRPRRIIIELQVAGDRVTLTVRDDGTGLSEGAGKGGGMGLRIMQHRASMIGGVLKAGRNPDGGTIIECSFRNATGQGNETETKNIYS